MVFKEEKKDKTHYRLVKASKRSNDVFVNRLFVRISRIRKVLSQLPKSWFSIQLYGRHITKVFLVSLTFDRKIFEDLIKCLDNDNLTSLDTDPRAVELLRNKRVVRVLRNVRSQVNVKLKLLKKGEVEIETLELLKDKEFRKCLKEYFKDKPLHGFEDFLKLFASSHDEYSKFVEDEMMLMKVVDILKKCV